jgi:hypothetical protein
MQEPAGSLVVGRWSLTFSKFSLRLATYDQRLYLDVQICASGVALDKVFPGRDFIAH